MRTATYERMIVLLRAIIACLLGAVLLSGCTVQLAPDYDGDLLAGLVDVNKSTLLLMAKVETGSETSQFPDYAPVYAQSIATFSELKLRADARPVPPLTSRITKMPFLSNLCDPKQQPQTCLNATGLALREIIDGLRMMRDRHRDRGLSPEAVALFQGRYDIQIQQALTVETALNR